MWKKLPCSFSELNLNTTLGGGQSFRWCKTAENEWRGVLSGYVWTLKQDSNGNILYFVHESSDNVSQNINSGKNLKRQKCRMNKCQKVVLNSDVKYSGYESTLQEYFHLHLKLEDYYSEWSKADGNFKKVSANFKGIRILRQDPVENLFSFICSANNNIPRITSMVGALCLHYGKKISEVDGQPFHAFPTVENLAKNEVEARLRKLGFGYRAKYINQAAKFLYENRPPGWLQTLRDVTYREAHSELVKLPGVGAKVADCICLMSLDKYEALPVDTHIWQITTRDYLPHLKNVKSLTSKIYNEIGDFYRERFGDYAGWATTVLFAADLKKFKDKEK